MQIVGAPVRRPSHEQRACTTFKRFRIVFIKIPSHFVLVVPSDPGAGPAPLQFKKPGSRLLGQLRLKDCQSTVCNRIFSHNVHEVRNVFEKVWPPAAFFKSQKVSAMDTAQQGAFSCFYVANFANFAWKILKWDRPSARCWPSPFDLKKDSSLAVGMPKL